MVYLLLFVVLNEIFSYEEEKIVILSILSFFIILYFNIKETIDKTFSEKSEKLKKEYIQYIDIALELCETMYHT